jgi:hypothetical protein
MKRSEFTEEQILFALKQADTVRTVLEAWRDDYNRRSYNRIWCTTMS